MTFRDFSCEPAGDAGLILRWARAPEPALTAFMVALSRRIAGEVRGVTDTVTGYNTLALFFDPSVTSAAAVAAATSALATDCSPAASTHREVSLPVYYHDSVAPDLTRLARTAGMSVAEVITLHTQTSYFAYATGFAPGFCYLGEVDARLATPRLATPRRVVPAGSVGIAERQTAVYPRPSPGGWNLIGRCPTRLFDAERTPPNTVAVGDVVRFVPVDREAFLALGGVL